jgi:hypothetical protein
MRLIACNVIRYMQGFVRSAQSCSSMEFQVVVPNAVRRARAKLYSTPLQAGTDRAGPSSVKNGDILSF